MRFHFLRIAVLAISLAACGSAASSSGADPSVDVAADVGAVDDAQADAGTDAVVPADVDAQGTDVAAAELPPDVAPDDADAQVDTDALDATEEVAATDDAADAQDVDDAADGEDAPLVDALADATDDVAVDATDDATAPDAVADADAAVLEVDAGPAPLGLNAAVTLTAPQDGAVVNVGDALTVAYTVDSPPSGGAWIVTATLGADATATESLDALPAQDALQVTVKQAGQQTLTLRIWQDGVLVAEKTVTILGNLPPGGTPVLAVSPSPATVQTDLQASVAQPSVDPEGAALNWTWQWLKDGQPTTFTGQNVPSQWLKKGQTWTVKAVASDGYAAGPVGTLEVAIVNSPPTAVVLADAPPNVGLTDAVTATIITESTDADGDPLVMTFAWTVGGQLVGSTPSLNVPTVLLNGQHLTPGDLHLTVTVVDSDGAKALTEQAFTIVATPVCGTTWWTCDPNASCTDDGTLTPPCTCASGYLGDGKTCKDVDECVGNPCNLNAKCVNTPGSFTCTCASGFVGNGFACTDIDECADGTANCSAFATCANKPGSFGCTCVAGYAGTGIVCTDVDECALNTDNCDANATCVNTPSSFQCTCNAGWSGDGTSCADVDECADPNLNVCDKHAACINSSGGYDCQCQSGWTGSGLACADVNECTDGTAQCDFHATCKNGLGSFSCICDSGYEGTGQVCTDANECQNGTAVCDANATCGNTTGSYICACNAGYIGDGKTCTALCDLYCNAITSNCTGANQQYADLASCEQTCKTGAKWPAGQVGDTSGDSLACRYTQANSAALAPATFCTAAGPAGGNICGTWCDGYCDLMLNSCVGAYATVGDCHTACGAFPTSGVLGNTVGDTLQCRLTYAEQVVSSVTPANTCAYAGAISSHCTNAVDLGGWKLEQANSTQSYTIPAGTTVANGGYLIISRASTKAEFETFWGVTLGANVTFLQSAPLAQGTTIACPQINGLETFTLRRADTTIADGPTAAMQLNGAFIWKRSDLTFASGNTMGWTSADANVKTNATLGGGQTSGQFAGPYISEFGDALGSGNFIYEYVEVYVDPGP